MRIVSAVAKLGCLSVVVIIGLGLAGAFFAGRGKVPESQAEAPPVTPVEPSPVDKAGAAAKKFLAEMHGPTIPFRVLSVMRHDQSWTVSLRGGSEGKFLVTVDDAYKVQSVKTGPLHQTEIWNINDK